MGRSKALLPCPPHGDTFVSRVIKTLWMGGVVEVAVVGRAGDTDLQREVQRAGPQACYVPNLSADLGQLSSVLVGISYAEQIGAGAAMIVPVDMPSIGAATVAALLHAFETGSHSIVRAVHRGRHGHPVIFAARLFDELRRADPSVGARAIMHANPSRVRDVVVDDSGVLLDIDTPVDYKALLDDSG